MGINIYVLKYMNYVMPAHLKASLIGSSVTIPITNGRLNLGTWQGIYLCEFRNHGGSRSVVVTIMF
jgi:secondary thiamine-phosphate synthase enzyme